MKSLLKNKNVLIMGLRNKWSIAWGIAEACRSQGANLILSYQGEREKKGALKLAKHLGSAECFECDVASDRSIDRLFSDISENYNELYAVVHCIAHANKADINGNFIDTSRAGFMHAMDISAYSLVAIAKRASQLMKKKGSIVALSYLGSNRVLPNYNVMGVAKAALESSIRYLASELGKSGVRINGISAGPLKTISSKAIPNIQTILDAVSKRSPLRRNITQEDVGKSALYLLSDLSSGITGEIIYVDNGYNIMGI